MNNKGQNSKKTNYLFITSCYLPNPDASGLCVSLVAEELLRQGNEVECISYWDEKLPIHEVMEHQNIYRIPKPFYSRIRQKYAHSSKWFERFMMNGITFVRKIKSVFILPFFPSVSLLREWKIYCLASKLIKEKKIDCVVGSFRPFDGVSVAIKLKKKYPNLKTCAYFLDLLHCDKPAGIPKNMYEKLCSKRLLHVFQKVDLTILPMSGKKEFKKSFYDSIRSKLYYAEFPLVREMKWEKKNLFFHDDGQINLVYAGTISKQIRDPSYLLKLFSKLRERNSNLFLHIFGPCNDPEFKKLCDAQDGLIYYGKVESKIAYAALGEADVAINISNQASQMVPSKIFELFSFRKPILNFVKEKMDCALSYIERYPLVCNVFEYENNLGKDVKETERFLENFSQQGEIKFETVCELYKQCTPHHIIELLAFLQRK
ncbi:hypothetical protein [Acetivibrio sp. MSJd-27]|uniref:hypothetical protein n=1 Tax=Acetivibrio sp. MSJd-27 TaxID=2841523 RepID=UPI001C11581D|nr:hypothetical protein [Acetivibrio sp. MSJd-27]MBU5450130.1 hypothetical protein [Acetivibrio sp. MSJd-27]